MITIALGQSQYLNILQMLGDVWQGQYKGTTIEQAVNLVVDYNS
jgi:hypothetical protein